MDAIKKVMSNPKNIYAGHGAGRMITEKTSPEEQQIFLDLVFTEGLRCSHGRLSDTTLCFGPGSEMLFEENEKLINNWKHKDSKLIIIVSTPYIFYHPVIIDDQGSAYCYDNYKHLRNVDKNEPTKFLRPEFVSGAYDVTSKKFIANPNYYENLSEEKQKELFDKIKTQFEKDIYEYERIRINASPDKLSVDEEIDITDQYINEYERAHGEGTFPSEIIKVEQKVKKIASNQLKNNATDL